MKTKRLSFLAASALSAAFFSAAATEWSPRPESRLWLEGDSTLHPFSSTATHVEAAATIDAADPEGAVKAIETGHVAAMNLSIEVADLKSAHTGLDKNLRSALKADKNPRIAFKLDACRASSGAVTADGDLSIAGQTRPVVLTASAKADGAVLVVEGAQPLKMSDFGVKPPSLMLGTLKVKDRVTVHYRLELAPARSEK